MEIETESFEDCRKKTPEQEEQEKLQAEYRQSLVEALGEKTVAIFTAQEAMNATQEAIEDTESQKVPKFIVENSESIAELHSYIGDSVKNGYSEMSVPIEDNCSWSAFDMPEMKKYFDTLGYKYDVQTEGNYGSRRYVHHVKISWPESEQ